jgi:hypothetical protein
MIFIDAVIFFLLFITLQREVEFLDAYYMDIFLCIYFYMDIFLCRIKPYMISRYIDDATGSAQHFPADKARIFAKAISNAMPFEKLDLMISRQSL